MSYPGPDEDANKLHSDVKARFIEADKEYYSKTGRTIQINHGNSFRTVRRQAELYINYYILICPQFCGHPSLTSLH